jgi:hypothetical protein
MPSLIIYSSLQLTPIIPARSSRLWPKICREHVGFELSRFIKIVFALTRLPSLLRQYLAPKLGLIGWGHGRRWTEILVWDANQHYNGDAHQHACATKLKFICLRFGWVRSPIAC